MSPRAMRMLSRAHVALYRATHGRLGWRTLEGYPVLLLTTRGRRSGRPRTAPLVYQRTGDRYVVCGGSGGTPCHPGWFSNLRAHDRVTVQVRGRRFAARAREAEGPEREALWRLMAATVPRVEDYQRRLSRRVPVVVLEPIA